LIFSFLGALEGVHVFVFFELLVSYLGVDRISGVTFLDLLRLVDLHVSLLATNLLHRELDSPNFEDVAVLNLVVL
jgi:hypothetical protein